MDLDHVGVNDYDDTKGHTKILQLNSNKTIQSSQQYFYSQVLIKLV